MRKRREREKRCYRNHAIDAFLLKRNKNLSRTLHCTKNAFQKPKFNSTEKRRLEKRGKKLRRQTQKIKHKKIKTKMHIHDSYAPKNSGSLVLSMDCTRRLVRASTSASFPTLSGLTSGWLLGGGAKPRALGDV